MKLIRTQRTEMPTSDIGPQKQISSVISAIGFSGASGRTSVVRELAWYLQRHHASPVLVDADLDHPSLVHELGVLSSKGLLEVLRQIERERLTGEVLGNQTISTPSGIALIPGLIAAHRWSDIPIGELTHLLSSLQATHSHVLLDLAAGFESAGAQRHVLTGNSHNDSSHIRLRDHRQLADIAIQNSQIAIVTSRADEISLARLVAGMRRHQAAFEKLSVRVVISHVISHKEEKECRKTVQKLLGFSQVHFIPHNVKLMRESGKRGIPCSDIDAGSDVAQAFAHLAEDLDVQKESTLATQRVTSVLRRAG